MPVRNKVIFRKQEEIEPIIVKEGFTPKQLNVARRFSKMLSKEDKEVLEDIIFNCLSSPYLYVQDRQHKDKAASYSVDAIRKLIHYFRIILERKDYELYGHTKGSRRK